MPAPERDDETIARQHALFAGSELARKLVDALPSIVLVLNEQRRTVYANRGLLELVGLDDVAGALGRRPGDFWDCPHAASPDACGTTRSCGFCGALEAILAAMRGEPRVSECSIRPRGTTRRVDLRVWATPLSLHGEQFTVVALADIAEERRRRALEHIFFHDVLNTAGAIRGAVELLHAVDSDQTPLLEQMIADGSRRLIEEVRAQRDLLAAEAGELACDRDEIDALALLREQAGLYAGHPVARERRIAVDGDQGATLVCDRTLLGRVIGNLLKNALEAARPGQTVTLRSRAAGEQVRFEVHNPDPMPEAVQLQVFDRTFSTKGPGRGLGTYSVKLLTERYLGGRASFRSSADEGTTFWVTIPQQPPTAVPTASAPLAGPP